MNAGRRFLLAGLAAGAAAAQVSTTASGPAPPPAPDAVAAEFLAAFRASDELRMAEAAGRPLPDPFYVVDALFPRGAGEPARAGEREEAARAALALATRVGGLRENASLADLVRRWSALDAVAWEADGRLRDAARAARRARTDGKALDALPRVPEWRALVADAPPTIAAPRLLLEIGQLLHAARRLDAAREAYGEAAGAAAGIGWEVARVAALEGRARVLQEEGELEGAREAWAAVVAEWEALGDGRRAAQAGLTLGSAFARLRQWDEALPRYERAHRELAAEGDRHGAATALGNVAVVLVQLGRPAEALEIQARVLEERRAIGDRAGVARALSNLSEAHEALGDLARAVELEEEALARREELGDAGDAAVALTHLGVLYPRVGRSQRARECLERALATFEERGERGNAARARSTLGALLRTLGAYAEAHRLLARSVEEKEALGDPVGAAISLVNLGNLESDLGRLDRARQLYDRARALAERAGDRRNLAYALASLASLAREEGRPDESARLKGLVLEEFETLGLRQDATIARANLAGAWVALGRLDDAQALIDQVLADAEEAGNRPLVAAALTNRAAVEEERRDFASTLSFADRALAEWEALGDRPASAHAMQLRGVALAGLGRFGEAIDAFRRCAGMRIALGGGLGEDEALALRPSARAPADWGLFLAGRLLESDPGPSARAGREAFAFAESGRALVLSEGIVNREALLEASVPPALLVAEAQSRVRLEHARARVASLAREKNADRGVIAAARRELDEAYSGSGDAVSRIRREASARVSGLVLPRPLTPEELAQRLRPDEAFVLYGLARGSAFAVVAGTGEPRLVALGAAAPIAEKAERYLRLVAAPGGPEEALAAELYEALLRPLEGALAGKRRLLLSPDGALHFLPFEALRRVEGGVGERAIERLEIAYVPSGTAYAALVAEARDAAKGEGILAVGDPVYPDEKRAAPAGVVVAMREATLRGLDSFPRIPASGEEARAVAALFPDGTRTLLLREAATTDSLSRALAARGPRLAGVHFACHGHLDAERPRLTGLVLSNGEVLSLDAIARLPLRADLVVLSACETGKGSLVHGEGVVGLVRSFFVAGAPRVVVSNWTISDETTRDLMVSFYRHMREGGLGAASALRRAKVERLRAGGALAHPAHWAAFVLWGLPD